MKIAFISLSKPSAVSLRGKLSSK